MQYLVLTNLERIFQICNLIALVGWLLLAFFPGWKITQRIVLSGAVSLVLSAIYLLFVVIFFGQASGSFTSLDGVNALFSHKPTLLAAWIHYLAFDLFVGAWQVADSRRIKKTINSLFNGCSDNTAFTNLFGDSKATLYTLF